MTPRYHGDFDCSVKFAVTSDMRVRFAAACERVGVSQAEVLRQVVEAWTEEIEGLDPNLEEPEACSTSTT